MADGTPSHADYGRMGGRPITTGSVVDKNGSPHTRVHIARLQALADASEGRAQQHLLAAIACIRVLAATNRRMGNKVGAMQRRRVLTHRGLELTGPAEDMAETIASLAGEQPVSVYRLPRKRVRVTTAEHLGPKGELHRIGTYDIGCDYRQVVEDVREALGQ